ncbi:MAG: hypothetical protein AAF289_01160 [Cyanobacteria bacterium P01_A01_bin.135]
MTADWDSLQYDQAWLEEAIADEVNHDCDVQVGGKPTSMTPPAIDPVQLQQQLQQVRLQSMLFGELRGILERSNLGAGTEAAMTLGRQLIRERLSHLSPQQQKAVKVLLTPNHGSPPPEVNQLLCSLLNLGDWQSIAQSATDAIEARLLSQVTLNLPA